MPHPELIDRANPPDDKKLETILGESKAILDKLIQFMEEEYGSIRPEWKYYGPKYGWTMKIFYKRRNSCFITPDASYFNIGFVFGGKAVAQIEKSELPAELIKEIVQARKYAEGRGLSLKINEPKQLEILRTLINIKLNN